MCNVFIWSILQEDSEQHDDLLIKQIESETRSVLQEKLLSKKINVDNFMTEYGTIKLDALNKVSIAFEVFK